MSLLEFLSFGRNRVNARPAYAAIMKQSRQPFLFGETGAPDSFDGRFDVLALHVHFVLRRLRTAGTARTDFGQALFDLFFRDMDQAMREAGVGDLSVGKKIRKMTQAFYGRAQAYDNALGKLMPADDTPETRRAMRAVLARNLFPDGAAAQELALERLTVYVFRLETYLHECALSAIEAGSIFPLPPYRGDG